MPGNKAGNGLRLPAPTRFKFDGVNMFHYASMDYFQRCIIN
jgi:hypothetical protein